MKAVLLCASLALATPYVAADVPDSIIGTWELDPDRTMEEVFDRIAARQREANSSSSLGSLSQGKTGNEPRSSPHGPVYRMTITEDTITAGSPLETPKSVRYTIVGGNAGLLVIESVDENGLHSVGNIRLVEGGIAIDGPDCEKEPDRCRVGPPPKSTDDPVVVATDAIRDESAERPVDTRFVPKVLYFKRASSEQNAVRVHPLRSQAEQPVKRPH